MTRSSTRRPIFRLGPIGAWIWLISSCGAGAAGPSTTDLPSAAGQPDRAREAPRPVLTAPSVAVEAPPTPPQPTAPPVSRSPATLDVPLVNDDGGSRLAPEPEPVTPPFSASARPGDGEWIRYASEEGSQHGLWRTTLHPHRSSAFVSVSVVAMDLRTYGLDWVVGSSDEGAEQLRKHMSVGLIEGDAVAVFNGGFQARHGRWGQVSHGITLVQPKPEGCGVALTTDGRVHIGAYAALAPLGLVTYRQTPPCLVSNGAAHPDLLSGRDKIWAGKSASEKTRRRSALGLSQGSQTLYYLVGVETDALDLARALVALGVDVGLELDINWNWTRFFLVGQKGGSPNVHSPLLEGMVMDAGEYVRRPSKRDFFVVRRRK